MKTPNALSAASPIERVILLGVAVTAALLAWEIFGPVAPALLEHVTQAIAQATTSAR
jgi:hypothetical protein